MSTTTVLRVPAGQGTDSDGGRELGLRPASPAALDATAALQVQRGRTLRVGLMGFGRTGREVASTLLKDETMCLEWVIRRSDLLEHRSVPEFLGVESEEPGLIYSASAFNADELLTRFPVDVIIDFSSDSGLDYYADAAADRGVAIVTAISRYSDAKQRQLERCAGSTRVLWSPNITLGINFMLLAAQALQRMAPGVDVQIVEEHFRAKAEISGTALRLARALDMPEDAVHVIRAGGIIGVHEILFGFPAQTVRLRHEAISREAFGQGAAFAARQIVDRDPGLYCMEDLLLPYFADRDDPGARPTQRRGGVRGRLASRLRAAARRLE
jgi:4-hydroxy-tetrahydrodipicolinate reductase